ncbi:MAG: fasciclin domain-containing protein [Odoribacter sp.]
MKGIVLIISVFLMSSCGTKYNYIDTGTCKGYYDGTIYEYLKQDRGHWDSITKVIEKCSPEVLALFETQKITFFGPKNIAFQKYFYWGQPDHISEQVVNYNKEAYACINEWPRTLCDSFVKSHLVLGVTMRDDVPRLEKDDEGVNNGGGVVMTTVWGNKLWCWTIRNPFAGVPEAGDVEMKIASVKADGITIINNLGNIATTNLEAKNGVVHALADAYFLGQFFQFEQ